MTNSATSNWWEKGGKPSECYGAFAEGKWLRGCAFDSADEETQEFVNKLIRERNKESEVGSDDKG